MPTWATSFTDLLWQNAIGLVPLAIIVAAICRWGACRPATRHVLWLGVLAWLPIGMFLPPLSFSDPEPSAETASPPRDPEEGKPSSELHGETSAQQAHRWHRRLAGGAADGTPVPQFGYSRTPHSATKPKPDLTPPHTETHPARALLRSTPPITVADSNENTPASADHLELASGLVVPESAPGHHLTPEPIARANTFALEQPRQTLASSRQEEPPTTDATPPPPTNPSTTKAATAAPTPPRSQLTRWLTGLAAVRDAVGRLPTFPPALWLAGIILMLAVRAQSVFRFRRRLQSGTAAPPPVVALVAQTAAKLGLQRAPETIMVRDRVSPMIWCGRKARLVLPQKLWNDLDHHGRRAVVSHELAHVRRKDHWVCWAESLVAAAYWWHPLVWWVRSKMRDEAENACDAWVTWLLPRGRRAYAEALLKTRQFAGEMTAASAAPAIGMVTGKTKRFARRLTMVMTQQQTPRLSTSGIVLALSLAVAGWVATPARSDEPRAPQVVETAPLAAPVPAVTPAPEVSTVAPAARIYTVAPTPPVAPVLSTVLAAPRPPHGHSGDRHGRDLAERMERLERRLTELAERLERVGQHGRFPGNAPQPRRPRGPGPDAPFRTFVAPPPVPGREIVETYRLPEGQLEALTKLMVRPDVPIRVRPLDGAIEVHGTEADQIRFKTFIALLSDKKTVEAYRLPPGQLKALTELMSRNDVPVMIEPGSDDIKVHGSPAVQAVFQAFVEMIHPKQRVRTRTRSGSRQGLRGAAGVGHWGPEARATARQALKNALAGRAEISAVRQTQRAARQKARALQQRARAEIRRATKNLSKRAKELERKADRLETEADRLEDRAQKARDKADALRDRLRENGGTGNKSSKMKKEADSYEARAKDLEAQAEVLLAKAEAMQDQADTVVEQTDELTEQIEAKVESELESIEEAIVAAQEAAEEHADNDDDNDDNDHDDDNDDDDDDDDDDDGDDD